MDRAWTALAASASQAARQEAQRGWERAGKRAEKSKLAELEKVERYLLPLAGSVTDGRPQLSSASEVGDLRDLPKRNGD